MHDSPLITTLVGSLVLAFLLGASAQKLRLPPLAGYLLAGIMAGPFTPGFVADGKLAADLAEIGVILLMFGVGLHFSWTDLLAVRGIAAPGALAQMAAATAMGTLLAHVAGWPLAEGLIFGLALSAASTVVLLRALQERSLLDTPRGRIAVGWLVVEDMAMVLTLVLLPALAGPAAGETGASTSWGLLGSLAWTLGKVVAFVALMLVVGSRVIPRLLGSIAAAGSHELFRLGVLAIALGVAYASAVVFGVSLALGAFFAGMVLNGTEESHKAAEETLPLRDAFAVLFFVSVGMLFDPSILLRQPWLVAAAILIVVAGKSLAALLIVRLFGRPLSTALLLAASLAQIGEFSFILAALGVDLGLLSAEARDVILAAAIGSILINSAGFRVLDRWLPAIERREAGTLKP